MSVVRKIWPADWRSLVVTVADISTPKGLVRVRFIYDKTSGNLFHALPNGVSFKSLGLTGGQTFQLLAKVKKACLWRVTKTEKAREKRERDEEQRARETEKKVQKKKAPRDQQELPF